LTRPELVEKGMEKTHLTVNGEDVSPQGAVVFGCRSGARGMRMETPKGESDK